MWICVRFNTLFIEINSKWYIFHQISLYYCRRREHGDKALHTCWQGCCGFSSNVASMFVLSFVNSWNAAVSSSIHAFCWFQLLPFLLFSLQWIGVMSFLNINIHSLYLFPVLSFACIFYWYVNFPSILMCIKEHNGNAANDRLTNTVKPIHHSWLLLFITLTVTSISFQPHFSVYVCRRRAHICIQSTFPVLCRPINRRVTSVSVWHWFYDWYCNKDFHSYCIAFTVEPV